MAHRSISFPPFFLRVATLAIFAPILSSCGTIAPPPNMPPQLSALAYLPVSGDPYSGLIERIGPPVLKRSPVGPSESFLTIPFGFRTTAVLTEPVRGYGFNVGGTLAETGAPGYFAGTFASNLGGITREMWCFFRPQGDDTEPRDPLCLLRDDSGLAAIAPSRLSPYMWTSFSPITGTFDYANTPIFALSKVTLPVDLAMDYRFAGWDEGAAKVEVHIRDKMVRTLRTRTRADGAQVMDTIAGEVIMQPIEGQPSQMQAILPTLLQGN